MADILYIAVPCYKEEEVLPETAKRLKRKMSGLITNGIVSPLSKVVFINDGSNDRTWDIIKNLHEKDALFSGINLSRNRGHQNALLAGLMTVYPLADMVISMDADLQDDVDAVDEMIAKYYSGSDIVYGVRSRRDKDTFFKRASAEGFYKLMEFLGAKIVFNHADYRLMSKRALESMSGYKEVNLFLRGIVPLVGYPSDTVYYERSERFAGESKYPLKKMIAFAFEGVTSLSTGPIRLITFMGIGIFAVSAIMLIYFLIRYFTGATIVGWASIAVSIWAIGGLNLLALGVIGEYVGKIYLETKARPRYIIESFINDKDKETD